MLGLVNILILPYTTCFYINVRTFNVKRDNLLVLFLYLHDFTLIQFERERERQRGRERERERESQRVKQR